MTDLESLYAGVCARPDEDTPRLVLADWLDEQGRKENEFRADLIRTHCRLARLEPWSPEWRELSEHWQKVSGRFERLKAENKVPWAAHLKGRVRAWGLERGLVGHLTLFSKRFVNEGDDYFERDPVRSVKFVKLDSQMGSVKPEVLFKCPHLARVAKLDFDGSGLADKALEQFGKSPHVGGLRGLALGGNNPFSKAALPKLLPRLPALTELSLRANTGFATGHAGALAKCPGFARVAVLDLCHTGLKPEGVAALVGEPHASGLTHLALQPEEDYDEEHGYPLGPSSTRAHGVALCEALAASKHLTNLRELDLNYCNIGAEGAAVLAKAHLPALVRLRVSNSALTRAGLAALAGAPFAGRLLLLDIRFGVNLAGAKTKSEEMFPNAHIMAVDP